VAHLGSRHPLEYVARFTVAGAMIVFLYTSDYDPVLVLAACMLLWSVVDLVWPSVRGLRAGHSRNG